MSSNVICSGSRASFEPPVAPVCETTSFDSASSHNIRRMTTGFVFTLSATCSDLSGSSSAQAMSVRTCTATANRLLVDISESESQESLIVCNQYSYSCLICQDLNPGCVLLGRRVELIGWN